MRRLAEVRPWVVLATLAVSACAPEAPAAPATLTDADKTAIQQTTTEFVQNMRAKNFAGVAALYASNAVLMPPNAPEVRGTAGIQAFLESLPPLTDFNLTQVTMAGSGDVAFVRGTYSMTIMMPDSTTAPDVGKYIEIWRKQADGSWLISHDIFNSDVPLPAAPTP